MNCCGIWRHPIAPVVTRTHDVPLLVARLTAVFMSMVAAVYALAQVEPSPVVTFCLSAAPTFAVVIWLQRDAARTNVGSVLDLGYFLLLAWPIVIPWYAFKTRGRAGWRLTVGLFGVILAPYATSFLLSALLRQLRAGG